MFTFFQNNLFIALLVACLLGVITAGAVRYYFNSRQQQRETYWRKEELDRINHIKSKRGGASDGK